MLYSKLGIFFVMFLSRSQDPASEAWDDQLEGDIEIGRFFKGQNWELYFLQRWACTTILTNGVKQPL